MEVCPGCGALFPRQEGPVHEYMEASPGCWHAYGQVLAREYGNRRLFAVHRLSVDSYAVQHPGGESRQAIQSVGAHLVRLCLFLERGLSATEANAAMLRVGRTKAKMFKLIRPNSLGSVTVADVLSARDDEAHAAQVQRWATSCWQAWAEHHEIVRRWTNEAGPR